MVIILALIMLASCAGMRKSTIESDMDAAVDVGASANSYTENTDPNLTEDYLLGINDYNGESVAWSVNRFDLANLQALFQQAPSTIGSGTPNTGAFTTMTATTPDANDNDTSVATTGYVQTEMKADTFSKTMVIETPTDDDNFLWFRVEGDITVTGIDCIVEDATSAAIIVQECDGDGDNCGTTEASIVCAVTNTAHATTIDDPDIDAGDWLRVDVGTIVGTPGYVAVNINFTKDSTW